MITVSLDITTGREQLTALEKDQLPFATALAVNRTTLDVQRGVRNSLRGSNFTIAEDRVAFMSMMVRFDRANYATKEYPVARLGVNDSEGGSGKDRSFILGRHEGGGVRVAPDPLRPFAIPSREIRKGPFDVAPRNLFPTALRLFDSKGIVSYTVSTSADGKKHRKGVRGELLAGRSLTARGKMQMKGKQNTFILDGRQFNHPGLWAIVQRTGPGRHDTRVLWWLRSKIVLKQRLHFYDTADRVIETRWQENFDNAMAEAIRTAY